MHDVHLNADKSGPLAAAMYSALLMHCTEGRCFSVSETDFVKALIAAWRGVDLALQFGETRLQGADLIVGSTARQRCAGAAGEEERNDEEEAHA